MSCRRGTHHGRSIATR
ncbi:hypothetical protein G5570_01645, partial [Pseudomonas aeruginosa]|nr:hypothetical protein [Pseudomonas aeruginosa]